MSVLLFKIYINFCIFYSFVNEVCKYAKASKTNIFYNIVYILFSLLNTFMPKLYKHTEYLKNDHSLGR